MAHVVIKVKGKEIASLNLTGPTVVGRAGDCRICVQDTLMSRHHLRLQPEAPTDPNKWTVIDLSSANGTRVDGETIQRHDLSDGDLLEAGSITMIFFEDSLEQGGSGDGQNPLVIGEKVLTGEVTRSITASSGGSPAGGSLSGVSLLGGSLAGGSLSGGSLSGGTLLSGSLSGGSMSGGSMSGGSVSGKPVSGGSMSGKSAAGRSVSGQVVAGRSVSGIIVEKPIATAPQVTAPAPTSDTQSNSQYMPKGVSTRGEKWDELAKTHAAPRTQPPTFKERLNKLPPAVALTAVVITGLVLFAVAFYLTNLLTG